MDRAVDRESRSAAAQSPPDVFASSPAAVTRRGALAAGAGLLAASTAGCLGFGGGSGSVSIPEGTPASTPTGPVAELPPDTGTRYATAGTDGPVVTYFGNWKCPVCKRFGEELLPDLAATYVGDGVRLRFRALSYGGDGSPFLGPDAPRAARAGLAVWNVEPASYWPFHEHVFANQPPESEQWATTDRLLRFAWEAGVSDLETVRQQLEAGMYEDAVRATTTAAGEAGVRGTPTLVADGQAINPVSEPDRARSLFESLATG